MNVNKLYIRYCLFFKKKNVVFQVLLQVELLQLYSNFFSDDKGKSDKRYLQTQAANLSFFKCCFASEICSQVFQMPLARSFII